jgi:HlyD family secretion protein
VRNAHQNAQNVVTYDVVLDVDNPEGKLRPGMTANVLILIVEKKQVVAVPNEALRFRPSATASETGTGLHIPTDAPPDATGAARQSAAVYVLCSGRAERAAVKTCVTDGNLTEVLSGLEPGTAVVLDVLRGKLARGAAPPGGAARGS